MNEITKLSQSFRCAFRGISLCIREERNFRIHICMAGYVTIFACIARLGMLPYAILCVCFALMLCAELLNSAVERLCDRSASGYDGFVRDAKDIAAAAVLVCAIFCVVVGGIFFLRVEILQRLFLFFTDKLWALGLFLVSLPISAAFIFGFQKIRK